MNTIYRFVGFVMDLIMVTRPVVLIPVWGFSALGFTTAIHYTQKNDPFTLWHYITFRDYGNILVFSASVAAVYIMNQIADIEVDKKNGGMPLIASGKVTIKSSILMLCICSIISICIPPIFDHTLLSVAALITLLLGYVYSFKPCRFSGKPILDFLTNALGYGIIAFSVGWILAGKSPFSLLFLASSLPYFFLMCAGSISSTLPDINGDLYDQKYTTAVVFGKIPSHTIALLFVLIAAILGILNDDIIASVCAGTSIPFYIGFYIRKNSFFMEATYKIGGGLCMIAAFIALPLFIPISLLVFLVTWLYFRIRHGISYPSLSSVQSKQPS